MTAREKAIQAVNSLRFTIRQDLRRSGDRDPRVGRYLHVEAGPEPVAAWKSRRSAPPCVASAIATRGWGVAAVEVPGHRRLIVLFVGWLGVALRVCVRCGEAREHSARGMCNPCHREASRLGQLTHYPLKGAA